MALPNNIFQAVQRYIKSELAYLENLNCFVATANTKFKNFQSFEGNLGDTVLFDLPPRFRSAGSLVVTPQASVQRVQSLSVDQSENVATDYTAQQWLFNLEPMEYMEVFGKSAVKELSTSIEINVAQNCIINHTYRFFGDGLTPINSFGQLAQALAFYRNYGSDIGDTKAYLSDLAIPQIVNSGLNQFVTKRNEEMAQSWMLGNFARTDWYQSNLLPVHTSGNVGQNNTTLTVLSTNDPTGANITQITFSGAGTSDANAIKAGDLIQFQDNVSGQPNLRYLTFVGHTVSGNPVQIRAAADAVSDGSGHVTISISPALVSQSNQNQNILYNIVAGMQVKALPSHRRGLILGGNALYLAMPKLPNEDPFATGVATDDKTGVSLRMYAGSIIGQNQRLLVHDAIWGSTMVDEYSMALIFPL